MKLESFRVLTCLAGLLTACDPGGGAATGDGGTTNPGGGSRADGGIEPAPQGSTASALDGVWVATAEPGRLLRYPRGATAPSDVIELAEWPAHVEIIDGVAFYLSRSIALFESDALHVQDLRTGERHRIEFSEESALAGLVFADGSLWVGDEALDVVWRVNPSTLELVGGTRLETYDSAQNDGLELAASEDSVYVSSLFGVHEVLRIDTRSGEVVARQDDGGDGTTGVAFGEGAAWATSRFDGTLWRYSAADLTPSGSVELGADISAMTRNVATAAGSVWVIAGSGGNAQSIFGQPARPGVFRVDAASLEPITHIPLEGLRALRTHDGAVWIATAGAAVQIDTARDQPARTLAPSEGEVVEVAFARTGGGTGSTAGLARIDPYSVVAPPAMTCEDLTPFYNHGSRPVLQSAMATLTTEAGAVTFDQGVCQTLRNMDGEVVEYMAAFSDTLDEPSRYALVVIDAAQGYQGDGSYTARMSWESAGRSAGQSASVVISQGGRRAVVTDGAAGDVLEIDCGADADVGLEPIPPAPPARGEVLVENADGVVFRFVNMDCGANILGENLTVTAPEYFLGYDDFYAFDLSSADPAEQGTLPGQVWFNYFGRMFDAEAVEIALTCGDPVTGTFSSARLRGSFTCL